MDLAEQIANLKNADPAVRTAAAEQIAHLEEEAQPAAVALVEAMGDADSGVRDWVYAALESLGPPRAEDAAKLATLAGDAKTDVAYWAVTLLGQLGAGDGLPNADTAAVVSAITAALTGHAAIAVRQRAAWALGQIGQPATSARAALEKAAAESDPRLSRLAKEALEKMKS